MKYKLFPGGRAPKRMSKGAAGFDVWARSVILTKSPIGKHRADISLGFAIDCDHLHGLNKEFNRAALLLPRPGWGTEYGFRLRNTAGVIDPDYRGEVVMKVTFDRCPPDLLTFAESDCNGCVNLNHDHPGCEFAEACVRVEPPRVGQMLIVPCYVGELVQVDELNETERGAGGFGSTSR